jgi:FkbM family methyltransferase
MTFCMLTREKKLARILANPTYRKGLRKGVAAGIEHELVMAPLKCNTVIDVGANRGQFALVARHCFPNARIVAFEPLPTPAQVFRELFSGLNGVVLHECAIGPEHSNSSMHVSARDDSSSLLPISDLQTRLHRGTEEVGRHEIRVERLSHIVSASDLVAPALLKVDVQGFEQQCLEGCLELLPHFKYLYIECGFQELYVGQVHASRLMQFIFDRGFELTGICHVFHDRHGQTVDADLLFTRREGQA